MTNELEPEAILNLHSVLRRSRANGPGVRFVVWFQGCIRNCPGCFNPETHTHAPHVCISIDDICNQILAESASIEGVTISGGEPLEQPDGLVELVCAIRRVSDMSILLFSGYTLAEIRKMPCGATVLENVDVLVGGAYNRSQHQGL